MRKQIHPRKRQRIFERDGYKCLSCGCTGDMASLELDHIIPCINGGTNEDDNLQTLCYKCNMDKRYGKAMIKQNSLLDAKPLERLQIIKDKLEEYKHLTYAEFRVIFTQDELFRIYRLDLLYLNDLFHEIKGVKRGKATESDKDKLSRDIAIKELYKIRDSQGNRLYTQEKLSELVGLSPRTIFTIVSEEEKP
jgi:DNA-binding XRE family transcriptional regulator